MTTVHFICRGNAHRSLMAEAYLKSLGLDNIHVMSSGSSADIYRKDNEKRIPHILAMLEKHHVAQFAKKHPEQLTQARADAGDVTICMNPTVAGECQHLVKLPRGTKVWNVDDVGEGKRIIRPGENPYKYTDEVYEQLVGNINELARTN